MFGRGGRAAGRRPPAAGAPLGTASTTRMLAGAGDRAKSALSADPACRTRIFLPGNSEFEGFYFCRSSHG